MNLLSILLAAVLLSSISPFAQANEVTEVPTREQADAVIVAEMQAREARAAEQQNAIAAATPLEEWEVDHGNRTTVIRRIAPPTPRVTIRQSEFTDEDANAPEWTEEEIAAWIAEQPVTRMLNLTAVVYDHTFTQITWRDEHQQEWVVLSNIDFRYLAGIRRFEDESHRWMTFLFIHEVNSAKEETIARRAAEKGLDYTPRTISPLLDLLPLDFFPASPLHHSTPPPLPEYIIVKEEEESPVPAALYEEMDAIHQHYHSNEERLIAEYERNKVMSEARRAWHEANPPAPEDTVINFWRVP